jgi:hypothetical protein
MFSFRTLSASNLAALSDSNLSIQVRTYFDPRLLTLSLALWMTCIARQLGIFHYYIYARR